MDVGMMGVGATPPQRLLVVSANIGEGHNATARAVEERAQLLWPECEIRRVDTLQQMGRGVGPGFRWIYRVNVDITPWLYDFFYRALWRHRWFAASSCRVVGAWSGMRLAPIIAEYQPDLVVSTYPLGTGGLDWIRRRGGLHVPVAAIISDFAPHPFWVYPEIDLHYVASESSLQAMYRAQPDARGAVGAPPVISAFGPADQTAARAHCGLPQHRLIVLISCGSLGFGSMERAVMAGLAADPEICVVVACGRNEALRARLVTRGEPAHRLVPLGWTSDMPALTAAADVVVTNAGGATALEAVASGRAVVMFEPIAGHGRANAELMAQAGLATLCHEPADLVAALQRFRREPARLAEAQQRALAHIKRLDFGAEVAALPALPRHQGARALSAPDAFFIYAATRNVPQQVGAVLLLAEQDPVGPPERLAQHLAALIEARTPALPMLRRRLELRRGRRPRWLSQEDIDPAQHLRTRTVGAAHAENWPAAVREFFRTPVPLDRPPWQLELVSDADAGRTAVLAKMHHALGDGLAVTATLLGLLSDQEAPHAARGAPGLRASAAAATSWRTRAIRIGRVLRGLGSLAATSVVAPGGPVGPSTPARSYAMVELPAAKVRAAAREHGVGMTALLLALVGETLHQHHPTGAAVDGRLRVMVPQTTQAVRRVDEGGNRTAAVAVNLPVGPMPLTQRVAHVAATLARLQRTDQPAAAHAVMHALGWLPAPLQARLAHWMYGRRFFTLIASVMPGPRRTHRIKGARVASVFPMLPLADGVGLAVGFLAWGQMLGVGVTTDTGLFPDAGQLADVLGQAFDDVATRAADVPTAQE